MSLELEFLTDPAAFLEAAGEHLAREPVLTTVVSTLAHRAVGEIVDGMNQPAHDWWLVVRERGAVVGAGMRTARTEPRPAYLLPMPDEAARLVARTVHQRGEDLGGINGALPAARICADEAARLGGGRVEVGQHTRLFDLPDPVPARKVPGRLRPATRSDAELVRAWHAAFMGDADDQAGRARGTSFHETPSPEDVVRRIDQGREWLWVDAADRPVHLTGVNPPSFGVARLGPVYTPPAQRGRGWASAAVAAVSQALLDRGVRPCLFTDQANPTSNRLYQALGYRPVVDMVNLLVQP